jgi:hypothetical protein
MDAPSHWINLLKRSMEEFAVSADNVSDFVEQNRRIHEFLIREQVERDQCPGRTDAALGESLPRQRLGIPRLAREPVLDQFLVWSWRNHSVQD